MNSESLLFLIYCIRRATREFADNFCSFYTTMTSFILRDKINLSLSLKRRCYVLTAGGVISEQIKYVGGNISASSNKNALSKHDRKARAVNFKSSGSKAILSNKLYTGMELEKSHYV